jgi:hypothetical protein
MTDQPNGLQTIADRYGVSLDAIRHLVDALQAGNGTMAQFNHRELGGFGQWSSGGMTMIGNMFDAELKARVGALCSTLAEALPAVGFPITSVTSDAWWPQHLGRPATSGSQNGLRYAYFPHAQRLAIAMDGNVILYGTAGQHITGVSQQQGGTGGLRFSGPDGAIPLESLRRIDDDRGESFVSSSTSTELDTPVQRDTTLQPKPFTPEPIHRVEAGPARAQSPADEVLTTLERLAELQRKGVLTEAEFSSKKAELLARL